MSISKILGQDEIRDPFSANIDDFLIEKNNKPTQEATEDKLQDISHMDNQEKDSPQDNLEDKSDEAQETAVEETIERLEDHKEDLEQTMDEMKKQQENYVESRIRDVGVELANRGFIKLASKFFQIAEGKIN